MDRFGVRPVMFVSLILIAIGFALRPFMTELWHWLALATLVYAGFPGATVLPAGKMVGLWFPNSMGRMTGIVVSGNNFGGMTMPPLAAANNRPLINWEWAYITFAIIMFGLATAVIALPARESHARCRGRNAPDWSSTPRSPTPPPHALACPSNKAIRTWAFWLTLIGLVAATFTYQGVLTQLRQHFGENGFAPSRSDISRHLHRDYGHRIQNRIRTRQQNVSAPGKHDRPQHRLPSRGRRRL